MNTKENCEDIEIINSHQTSRHILCRKKGERISLEILVVADGFLILKLGWAYGRRRNQLIRKNDGK